jgi:hypothetical protein
MCSQLVVGICYFFFFFLGSLCFFWLTKISKRDLDFFCQLKELETSFVGSSLEFLTYYYFYNRLKEKKDRRFFVKRQTDTIVDIVSLEKTLKEDYLSSNLLRNYYSSLLKKEHFFKKNRAKFFN